MKLYEQVGTTACGCDDPDIVAPLMTVQQALEAGLAMAVPCGATEELPLAEARGRILARPVRAQADMPRFDNSGMDGYALNTADIGTDPSAPLPVSGVSAAGTPVATLAPGTAMRIFTGAPVPKGADAVVMQEAVERVDEEIRIVTSPHRGENIRRRGEDQKRNARVLEAGVALDAKAIAACAGAGAGTVTVWQKLKIGLILTGDELCPAGAPLDDGAIWDVNTPMLAALVDCAWAAIVQVRHVPDTRAGLATALSQMAGSVDMVITSGGVSVGDRDFVLPVLRDLGAQVHVSGVAIKPGKPTTLSMLDGVPVISLPGNPLSAFVIWLVFGAPIAARMAGLARVFARRRHVRTENDLRHAPGRCEYRPATITGYGSDGLEVVATRKGTFSAQLAPLAEADGLVLIPAETDRLAAGDLLEFLPFTA